MGHANISPLFAVSAANCDDEEIVVLSIVRRYRQMSKKQIEDIITISIEYLDRLDGDPELEQDDINEKNGDEDDYAYPEWRDLA